MLEVAWYQGCRCSKSTSLRFGWLFYPTNRYPVPCTVKKYCGCSGSGSSF